MIRQFLLLVVFAVMTAISFERQKVFAHDGRDHICDAHCRGELHCVSHGITADHKCESDCIGDRHCLKHDPTARAELAPINSRAGNSTIGMAVCTKVGVPGLSGRWCTGNNGISVGLSVGVTTVSVGGIGGKQNEVCITAGASGGIGTTRSVGAGVCVNPQMEVSTVVSAGRGYGVDAGITVSKEAAVSLKSPFEKVSH